MGSQMVSDQLAHLMRDVANGDREAFRTLYARTDRFIFARIIELIHDQAEAEDLLQDVYVKIWQAAPGFDPERGSALAWIGAIARNLTINRLRSASYRSKALAEPIDQRENIPIKAPAAETDVIKTQRSTAIIQRIQNLRPNYRHVIEMAYIRGHSYAEISEQTGVPVNTLKTWIRRAIIELREDLEGYDL